MKDENGNWVEDTQGVHAITNSLFKSLYKREEGIDPSDILELVSEWVDEDMNKALIKPFSDVEIGDTLFQIGPLKAPGPFLPKKLGHG